MALITIFLKNAINKNCSEFNKKIFWEIFFSGIPDPDFDPDSTFSGFSEFFESVAYIKHLCRRIFELYQIVSLWTGKYYITSPLCGGNRQLNAVTGAGGPYINLCTGQVPRSEHSAVDHHPLYKKQKVKFTCLVKCLMYLIKKRHRNRAGLAQNCKK